MEGVQTTAGGPQGGQQDMSIHNFLVKTAIQMVNLPGELLSPSSCLYVAGDLHPNGFALDFYNHNLGDDLNIPLVAYLSGKKAIPFRYSLVGKGRDRHLVIGSILEAWSCGNAIVWGAGLMNPLSKPLPHPKAIYAVRGRLTRNELMKQGIACPEVYGDPAILLPYLYNPESPDSPGDGRVALVPHVSETGHPFVQQWRSQGGIVLDLKNYGDWKGFVRMLKSCRSILSSSLHGLILADAYGIPSRRIILGEHLGHFKFQDYYSAFREKTPPPLSPEEVRHCPEAELHRKISECWQEIPGEIRRDLLKSCPFLRAELR